jgi:hypothetical protein
VGTSDRIPSETDRPARWRALAAETLDLARALTDPEARDAMLLIAEKYMELAERAERRGKEDPSE